jgi:hypothetical protein
MKFREELKDEIVEHLLKIAGDDLKKIIVLGY